MKWHFGCSSRKFEGWHNTDRDVDLTALPLPFETGSIETALSQHVIEHLWLEKEVLPLFRELRRVVRSGGRLYLSCPDMGKICRAYCEGRLGELIAGRRRRVPQWRALIGPESRFVNELFHQGGEHHNLFDFELLSWALKTTGWETVTEISEADLLAAEPTVWPREDGEQALYVVAV